MPLLNYTTTISVDKSVGEIQGMLARVGAKSIMTDYDDQRQPSAIAFLIATPFGERAFRLPVNTAAVWGVLVRQKSAGAVAPRFVTREQAARVGWRIVKDWLEAQLAIIETEMVSLAQVMLPYMQTDGGISVYERFQQRQMLLPAAEEHA